MTQDKPTDAQLVALARDLGWEVDVPPPHTEMPPWLMNPIGEPIRWLRTWEGMGAIQAAMAGLGWALHLVMEDDRLWGAIFDPLPGNNAPDGDFTIGIATAPDAVALAACAALGLPTEEVNR